MTNEISEKYNKYLVLLKIANNEWFILCGMKTKDRSYDDFIVTDNKQRIVVFDTFVKLKSFVHKYDHLIPDRESTKDWIRLLSKLEPYLTVNIDVVLAQMDKVHMVNDLELNVKEDIFNFIQIVTDYIYMINDSVLFEMIEDVDIEGFMNQYYSEIVWSDSENIIDDENLYSFEGFKKSFITLIDFFCARCILFNG